MIDSKFQNSSRKRWERSLLSSVEIEETPFWVPAREKQYMDGEVDRALSNYILPINLMT